MSSGQKGGGKNKPPEGGSPPSKGGGAPSGGGGGNKKDGGKDLASNYIMAQINQCLKSDRVFHSMISSQSEFRKFLALLGKISFNDRGQIARGIQNVVNKNARLVQDTKVLEALNIILRNLPPKNKMVQDFVTFVLMKLREAMIKNKAALDLTNKVMVEYSKAIQKILSFASNKIKSDFFSSLDEKILNFVLGKLSEEERAKKNEEREKTTDLLKDDEDDAPITGEYIHELVSILFKDVMRLQPELVSAVILSIIADIPNGNMEMEDKKLAKDWKKSLS